MAPAGAADAADATAPLSGWERAVAKFSAYFEERGLGPQDIPTAIVIHEVRAARQGWQRQRVGMLSPPPCACRRAARRARAPYVHKQLGFLDQSIVKC